VLSNQLVKPFRFVVLFSIVIGLSACGENAADWFAADPQLEESPGVIGTTPDSPDEVAIRLPDDFPMEIPRYPDARLLNVSDRNGETRTLWATNSTLAEVQDYYQRAFQEEGWRLEEESATTGGNTDQLVARGDDLQVTILGARDSGESAATTFTLSYRFLNQDIADRGTTRSISRATSTEFTDLDEVPEPLQTYVEEVAALGVLTAVNEDQFQPSEPITRRDFANWLVSANNRIYRDRAGQQIRTVPDSDTPAFSDVSPSDPDFAVIQGLAEAGIIPSRLSGSTNTLFRPDAPLNREDLLAWKVPLDIRGGLPKASVETVKEVWGFQDVSKIDPNALPAVLADYESGEQSNIRRVFGYTTLLQPDKPVTRAEAAATLWYFGTPGEGISAEEAQAIQ
jgi:hypothetical protein